MSKTKYLINFIIFVSFLTGCEKQYLADDGYSPEITKIEAKEIKQSHFFESSLNFDFSPATLNEINKLIKDTRSKGISNVGFMIITNQTISYELQKKVKNQLHKLFGKHGFISSRVVDSGVCTYKEAKVGVRIDVLKYDVKTPNYGIWSEYIGDLDTNKNLPKYGSSAAYNLVQMTANKADLIAPRKYKGQEAKSAIDAINNIGSRSSGSGSSSGASSSSSSGSSSSSSSSSSGLSSSRSSS